MPTILWGPADITVPEVYTASPDPASYDESLCVVPASWSGLAGDVVTCSFTSAVQSAGGADFDVYLKSVGAPSGVFAGAFFPQPSSWSALAGGATSSLTLTAAGSYQVIVLDGGNGIHGAGGIGTLVAFEVVTSSGATTACVYGTQLTTPTTFLYYLTPGLIDLVLAGTGEAWAIPFLTALWFTTVNAQNLCSVGPPVSPVLTIDDFVGQSPLSAFPDFLSKVTTWFEARLWNYLCECKPAPMGFPAPTPYPPPGQTAPPGIAPIVMFDCDGTDVCTILNQLGQAIGGLNTNLISIRSQVDLIQRQSVPFAYVPGITHFGLHGSGTLTVQGILGLSIQSTTIPTYLTADMAPVNSFYKLATISLGTADGWQRRLIVTHNPHLILDIDGDITRVGYLFEPGVTANIEELLREP